MRDPGRGVEPPKARRACGVRSAQWGVARRRGVSEGGRGGLCYAHFPTMRRNMAFFSEMSARLRLAPMRCSTRMRLTISRSVASWVSMVCAFQSASSPREKTSGFGGMHAAEGCCVPPGEPSSELRARRGHHVSRVRTQARRSGGARASRRRRSPRKSPVHPCERDGRR